MQHERELERKAIASLREDYSKMRTKIASILQTYSNENQQRSPAKKRAKLVVGHSTLCRMQLGRPDQDNSDLKAGQLIFWDIPLISSSKVEPGEVELRIVYK